MTGNSRGFALLLVIWSLVLLTGLATGFAYAVRHETRAAGDIAALAHGEAASEAAIRYAVLKISSDDLEGRWEADGQTHEVPWPDATITVRVQSEGGRIDLNKAPRDILVGLFEQVLPEAEPEALADAVIDWRDHDDEPGPAGMEKQDYARAGYTYGPTNRPFHSVHEMSQVMGFDRDAIEAATPHVTVHAFQARIHAASAGLVALASIPGISRVEAEAFIAYRDSALAAGEKLDFNKLRHGRQYLDTRTSRRVYSLEVDVRLADGVNRREHVVVRPEPNGPFMVLSRDSLPVSAMTAGVEQ